MFKLAEALGRLALAGRELTRLSGFTTRVDTLLNVLHDLEDGKYQRTMVGSTFTPAIKGGSGGNGDNDEKEVRRGKIKSVQLFAALITIFFVYFNAKLSRAKIFVYTLEV